MSNKSNYEVERCGIDLKVLADANITSKDNKALVIGILRSNLEVSYVSSITGEVHYKTIISVSRKSGEHDSIRIMIPESVLGENREKFARGVCVKVSGLFCSHLHKENGKKNRLMLYVLAEKLEIYPLEISQENNNIVYLKGIVNQPVFTKRSPVSGKKITEIFVRVNRGFYPKADYIPCVVWGRAAYEAEDIIEEGDQIVLAGRIQSRSYAEKGKGTNRVINEVSVFGIFDITKKLDK